MNEAAFAIASLLQPYQAAPIRYLGSRTSEEVTKIVARVCELVIDSDLIDEDIKQILPLSGVLANLAAMTPMKTTDAAIKATKDLAKIMFLYTVRNNVSVNSDSFFAYNRELASLWFASYALPVVGMTNSALEHKLLSHYRRTNVDFVPQAMWSINLSSYVTDNCTRLKSVYNRQIRNALKALGVKGNNKPDPTRIGVVAGYWPSPATPFIDALTKHFQVTLFHCTPVRVSEAYETVQITRQELPRELLNNSFKLILHLDPTGSPELLQLANLRLAPIQATLPTRPFSTAGTEIDLIITGRTSYRGDEFSERIACIPGPGLPIVPIQRPTPTASGDGHIQVGVVCSSLCYTYQFLSLVKYFVDQHPSVQLVVFPGRDAHRQQAMYSLLTDLINLYGRRVGFIPHCEESELHRHMSSLDFVLDTWPHSDFQAITTALQLGKPVVTMAAGTFSSEMTQNLLFANGFSSLVARDVQEYMGIASELALEKERLDKAKDAVYNTSWKGTTPDEFVAAITKLMALSDPRATYEVLRLHE